MERNSNKSTTYFLGLPVLYSVESKLIYGVDPGTRETGWVLWDTAGHRVLKAGVTPNSKFLEHLRAAQEPLPMFIEMIACYGMSVGKETFQTVLWIGRFIEVWDILGHPWHLCYRLQIKTHHCHSARAKDANVSQALRDKYGVVGTKKQPGPLFGVKSHAWSALAIATYAAETGLTPTSAVE